MSDKNKKNLGFDDLEFEESKKEIEEIVEIDEIEEIVENDEIVEIDEIIEIEDLDNSPKKSVLISDILKSNKFKYGSMATISVIVVTALVIILNMFATNLLERYPISADVTSTKMYDLSEESVSFLNALDKDIQITILTEEEFFTSASDETYIKIYNMIKRYVQQSSRLKMDFVNIVENPALANEYLNEDLKYGDIMFRSGDKVKVVSITDMVDVGVDYETNQQYIKGYKVEETMSKSILSVVSENQYKAVVLTGYESFISSTGIENSLLSNDYTLEEVSILTGSIPSDADVVVFTTPKRDLSKAEVKMIDEFLENGGELGKTFYYFPYRSLTLPTPNIDSFLADWGMKIEDKYVYETSANKLVQLDPLYLSFIANYKNSAYSSTLANKPFLVSISHPITTLFETSGNRRTEVLAISDVSSYLMPLDAGSDFEYSPTGENGPFNIMVTGEKSMGEEGKASRVIVNSSPKGYADSISSSIFGNEAYTMNHLKDIYKVEYSFDVATKEIEDKSLPFTMSHVQLFFVIFMVFVPLATLIIGLVIWRRRASK